MHAASSHAVLPFAHPAQPPMPAMAEIAGDLFYREAPARAEAAARSDPARHEPGRTEHPARSEQILRQADGVSITLPQRFSFRGRRDRTMSVEVSRSEVTFRSHANPAAVTSEPLAAYRGVAVTVRRGESDAVFDLSLLHEDEARSVPLSSGTDVAAMARIWQAWAKATALPLIAIAADGSVHAELTALGVVLAERPSPRRKGSPLVGRGSRYGRRRRGKAMARSFAQMPVHADEREIIARN